MPHANVRLSLPVHGAVEFLAGRHFDSIFLIATALFALGFALAGQATAAIFLAAIVGGQAALTSVTHYATRT